LATWRNERLAEAAVEENHFPALFWILSPCHVSLVTAFDWRNWRTRTILLTQLWRQKFAAKKLMSSKLIAWLGAFNYFDRYCQNWL